LKKTLILRILNPLLFVALILQAAAILCFKAGIAANIMFQVHQANGLVLIGLALLHFGLNWAWVRATYFTAARKMSAKPAGVVENTKAQK